MESDISKLILAIVSYVQSKGGYINKTKLVKFLYLIDLEFYRKHKKLLTGLNWIFYKFGPYSFQFEDIYSELAQGDLNIDKRTGFEYDADILSMKKNYELNELIPDPDISLLIRKTIAPWANEPLNKLLDYVYFETEPMENVKKRQPLDFSTVSPEEDEIFYLNKSNIKLKKLKKIRENLTTQLAKLDRGVPANTIFSTENYDQDYIEDILKMDSGEID